MSRPLPPDEKTSPAPAAPQDLAALFVAEESALLRYAHSLVNNRATAEELVSEAFLRLHRSTDTIHHPRAWLYRTVRNLAHNHRRDQKPSDPLDAPAAAALSDPGLLPDAALERMEALGMARLWLEELPAEDRMILRLKFEEERSYAEIAAATGFKSGTVGWKLNQLLKRLADDLATAGLTR